MLTVHSIDDRSIVPGASVGPVRVGMSYAEARAALGDGELVMGPSLGFVRYPDMGLELVLRAQRNGGPAPSARVIAVTVRIGGAWTGTPHPGEGRTEIEGKLGRPRAVGALALYQAGVSVAYDDDGRAVAIAVCAPFANDLWPRPAD